MKLHKFTLLASLALTSLFLGACTSDTNTAHQKSTAFGVFTYEPGCYAVDNTTTAAVTTDQVCGMELPSGDRLQLFWGLISIEDY